MKKLLAGILIFFGMVSTAWAFNEKPPKPTQKDKCPVCGMFVAKYTDFLAVIIFRDGSYAAFDGAKDMFKCYLNMKKYLPAKNKEDIRSIYVTEYYNISFVDAFKGYYIVGSDIYGPMGRELIPLEKEADAKEFLNDHKGKAILRFRDITDKTLRELE